MGGRSQVVVEEGERLFFFSEGVFVFGRGEEREGCTCHGRENIR